MPSIHLSRARGCLLGQIAGDNLGALVEFQSAASIATQYPDGPRLLADGGTFNLSAGKPTDDSEMALALARTCVLVGGYDTAKVAEAYVAWGDSHPFDMGGTTAAALAALRRGEAPVTFSSQANGALMRVSPLGILLAGDPMAAAEAAHRDSLLTHPHPVPVACNRAYAAAIATLTGGGTADQAFECAVDAALLMGEEAEGETGERIRPVLDALALARDGTPPADYQHQMGWVLIAFQNAFLWLARDCTFEEAVVETVRRGGDTDTNGAITGALLGAAQGEEAVPGQWRDAIRWCRPGSGSLKPRPETYWPNDAEALAGALVRLARRTAA